MHLAALANGKIERWHRELKQTIRPRSPDSLEDAQKVVAQFVEYYNDGRLHSALGYVTPLDKLLGIDESLKSERVAKLAKAAVIRKEYWVKQHAIASLPSPYGAVPHPAVGQRQEEMAITGGESRSLNVMTVRDDEILLDKTV